jgi:hypothetical protein
MLSCTLAPTFAKRIGEYSTDSPPFANLLFPGLDTFVDICQLTFPGLDTFVDIRQPTFPGLARLADIRQRAFLIKM